MRGSQGTREKGVAALVEGERPSGVEETASLDKKGDGGLTWRGTSNLDGRSVCVGVGFRSAECVAERWRYVMAGDIQVGVGAVNVGEGTPERVR